MPEALKRRAELMRSIARAEAEWLAAEEALDRTARHPPARPDRN
jgi:hypothetical protein